MLDVTFGNEYVGENGTILQDESDRWVNSADERPQSSSSGTQSSLNPSCLSSEPIISCDEDDASRLVMKKKSRPGSLAAHSSKKKKLPVQKDEENAHVGEALCAISTYLSNVKTDNSVAYNMGQFVTSCAKKFPIEQQMQIMSHITTYMLELAKTHNISLSDQD